MSVRCSLNKSATNFLVISLVVISKQILHLRIVHVKGFSLLLISISSREGFDKKGIEIEISSSIAMKFKYMCHLDHTRSTRILKDLTHTAPRFQKEALGNSKMDYNSMVEWFNGRRLNLIVRVNVVLNRTIDVDRDLCFDNLCGSHLQSQSELYHVS